MPCIVMKLAGFTVLSFETSVAGARLRYLDIGQGGGAPLVMLHGLGCASSFQYPAIANDPTLAGRRCLLIDFLGFGYSDQPEAFDYAILSHAKTVAALVDRLNLPRICLYGHSMGGSIAIEIADLLGERVENLILSEANLNSGGGQFSRAIAEMGEDTYLTAGHERVISIAERGGNLDWATMMRHALPLAVYRSAASLVQGRDPDWGTRLKARKGIKSFIFGENSLPDAAEDVLRGSDVRILTVPQAGHSMAGENPKGLAKAIAEALSLSL
ncbi:alpha/beta fold hydrolase [Thioclava sp. FR2]|uniref:alpha/beta fold hydrolase n=1 Tax=Thioclava sp. FR2 TaxID=3445780 RepID=UPI003EB75C47